MTPDDKPTEQQQHQTNADRDRNRSRHANQSRQPNAGAADPVDPDDVHDRAETNGHGDPDVDDEVTVDPADLTVTRNAEGELTPTAVHAGSLGTIKVYPMAYGDVTELFGDGQQMDIGADTMADVFGRFIAEPDLDADARDKGYDGLGGEYVKDMKPLVPRDLLMAVMEASGIDIDEMQMNPEETRAQMSVSGN